jgi:ketosteroid isomerase-like protein
LAPNTLARVVKAFQAADIAAAAALMHPEIVWHSPGRLQPAAGSHRGRDDVLAAFGAVAGHAGDLSLEIVDVLTGDNREVVVYWHRRRGLSIQFEANICLVARVADGQLIEVWEHIYDLYDFDEFYGES